MNLVDLIIILTLMLSAFRGIKAGLMEVLLSAIGFVAGLALGSWGANLIALSVSDPIGRLFLVTIMVFGPAALFSAMGATAGIHLKMFARRHHLHRPNQALGAVLAIAFTLIVIWLTSSALINVRNYGIGSSVSQSLIIRKLGAISSNPPDIFARLEKIISPNGFPNVFLGPEPQHTTVSPTNSVNGQALINDEASVVKIKGEGCGGVVFGSGFVVDQGVVITNAHVVAGIASPEVLDSQGTYTATPIWFDPDEDVAVLKVNGLSGPPLNLSSQILPDSDAAAVLGFPGGGPLVAANGVIIDHVLANGRNIYNHGFVSRSIYEVQVHIEPGNSGGPLLASDGSVAGIIFGSSLSQRNVGYALMIDEARPLIEQAIQNNSPASTGRCVE